MQNSRQQGIQPRFYRNLMGQKRFKSFMVGYKDSDLWVGIDAQSFSERIPVFAQDRLIELRKSLEAYIYRHPLFASSFEPLPLKTGAPDIAILMSKAAQKAGTGPMAAVAGAFAQFIGNAIDAKFDIKEIVIENGGDLFLKIQKDLLLSVYAGHSPLSGKIGLKIPAHFSPMGICTSAGTVGPSASFGKADAVVVASPDTALADAMATAIGNGVSIPEDIEQALRKYSPSLGLKSLLIVCNDKLGIKGEFELTPIQ
ncbi:MAG TPA: UPF0280 family protein [Prolixibacteraceae bacterium]|nr:UPF0280 family protein [Prolixibacteraceae bacterium]